MPIDFALSAGLLFCNYFVAPWYFTLMSLFLAGYNGISYKKKDHRKHFITKREYKNDFQRIERSYLIKSILYGLFIIICLCFTIMAGVEWLDSWKLGKKTRRGGSAV